MSYFLCLAVPQEVAHALPAVFDRSIYLTDVSELPIGRTTCGKHRTWAAYLLQIGSSSAALIGKGARKKTHNSDRSSLLVSGIQALMQDAACPSVSFLAHWMHGYITEEEIILKEEKNIALTDLPQTILDIEEDIRYIVS